MGPEPLRDRATLIGVDSEFVTFSAVIGCWLGKHSVVTTQVPLWANPIARTTCRINTQGSLSYTYRSGGGHWMCQDSAGVFSNCQPKFFERITPEHGELLVRQPLEAEPSHGSGFARRNRGD
jgi:hypothetical protein